MENDTIVGDDDQKKSEVSDQGNESSDKVDYKTYERTLSQLKKNQEINKSLAQKVEELQSVKQKVDEFEAEKKSKEEQELINKGEYKKLLELREQRIAELEKEKQTLASDISNHQRDLHDTWKAQSIQSALPGKIKRPEYFNFINFEDIPINPDSGRPDEKAVQAAAEKFMNEYPELVDLKNMKGLPGHAGAPQERYHTSDNFRNLSYADMKKNIRSLVAERKQKLGLT